MVSLKFLKKTSSGPTRDQKPSNSVLASSADAAIDSEPVRDIESVLAVPAASRPLSVHTNSDNTSTLTITDQAPLFISCPVSSRSPSRSPQDATSSSSQTLPSSTAPSQDPRKNPSMIFERTVQDQPSFSRRNSLLQTSEINHRCPNHIKSTPSSPTFDSFSLDSKHPTHISKQPVGSGSTSCCCSPKLGSTTSMSSPRLNAAISLSSSGLNALNPLSPFSSPPAASQSENHSHVTTPPQSKKTSSVSPSLSPKSFCTAIPAHYILDDYVAPSLDTAVTLQPSFKDQAPRNPSNQRHHSFSTASDNVHSSENSCPTAYVSVISRKPSIIEMSLNNYLDRTLSQTSPSQSEYSNRNGSITAGNNFFSTSSNQENSVNQVSSAGLAKLESSVDPLTSYSISSSIQDTNSNSPSVSPEASSSNICLGNLMHRRASLYSSLSPYKQTQNQTNINENLPQPVSSNMALSDSQDACFSSYADLLNDEIMSQ